MAGKAKEGHAGSADLVTKLLGFANNQSALKEFLDKNFDDAKDIPINKIDAQRGLQRADLKTQSLLCLFLLDALGNGDGPDEDFMEMTSAFLTGCSKDVRKFARRFVKLCRRFQAQTAKANAAKQAILPLMHAIGKLEELPQVITPIHALLFQSCLLAEHFSTALPYLQPEVCELNPVRNKLTMRDLLLFHYYGGLILAGRRQYTEAAGLLLQAVTAPALSPSAISIAAYKKYCLICLIQKGAVPDLPRFTPSCTQRAIKTSCNDYVQFSSNYSQSPFPYTDATNATRLKIIAEGDEALLNLACEAHTKREILRLTETYMTMPLKHISEAIRKPPEEAEFVLLRMIENGEISARIDHAQDLVSFGEDMSGIELSTMAQRIQKQLQESMHLAQKVKTFSHEVSCDKNFIQKTEGPAAIGPAI